MYGGAHMELAAGTIAARIVVLGVLLLVGHAGATLLLMGILGPAFDPFWKPLLNVPINSFRRRYLWTVYYSGAVVSRRVRRLIFENIAFDFRGRVSGAVAAFCALHTLMGVLILLGAGALGTFLAWRLYLAWAASPGTAPSRLLPDELRHLEDFTPP
jgi:hypothetical protein